MVHLSQLRARRFGVGCTLATLVSGLVKAGHARRATAPDSYAEVLAHFERALALEPALRFAQGEAAATLVALGRPEEALLRLEAELARSPQSVYLSTVRGYALLAAGRVDEAVAQFDQALAITPTNIAWTGKATALTRLDRVEEAFQAVEQALEWDSDDDAAWSLRSKLLTRLGRLQEALESVDLALEWDNLLTLDDHIEHVSKNLAVAGTRHQHALDLDDRLDVYRAKAALLRNLDREEEALSVEAKLYRQEATLHQQLGQQYFDKERLAEALVELDRALEIDPTWSEVWLRKGDILFRLGRDQAAATAFHEALQTNPAHFVELYNRANTLTNMREYDQALPIVDTALSVWPALSDRWPRGRRTDAEHMEALLLKLKGKVLSETGHLEEALACLDRALELAPDLYTTWRERGHAYNLLKRWTEAAADFEHALELNATSSYDWHSLAYTLYKCERYEEALAAIEQAMALDLSPAIVGTMGRIYLGMSDFARALEWLDLALEADPTDREHRTDKAAALRALGRDEEAEEAGGRALPTA